MKNDDGDPARDSFARSVPVDVESCSSDATLATDPYPVCTCNHHHTKRDKKQFTVISMTEDGMYYAASKEKRLLTRSQSETQLTFDPRSIEHPLHTGGNQSCLRKVANPALASSLTTTRPGPHALEQKAVRFTLNPSYLIYSDATLTQEDTAIIKQLNQLKNNAPMHPNKQNHRRRRSAFGGRKCSKMNRTKNYFMHPSTILLLVIFITIIVCIFFAKRRKRTQNIELNLFFALI